MNRIRRSVFPLLNDLLTGITPDGLAPKRSGFCLIAAQNPATDGGRFELSSDLMNRFHVIPVPEDTPEELLEMAQQLLSSNSQEKPMKSLTDFCISKNALPIFVPQPVFLN